MKISLARVLVLISLTALSPPSVCTCGQESTLHYEPEGVESVHGLDVEDGDDDGHDLEQRPDDEAQLASEQIRPVKIEKIKFEKWLQFENSQPVK